MAQTILTENNHITLPSSVIKQAALSTYDTLNVSIKDGVIMLSALKPNTQPKAQLTHKRCSIMDYAGITAGLYGSTAEDVSTYLNDMRIE